MLGLDEAGRGAAIGPLVVAGVALDVRKAGALTRRGVRDSKCYGAGKRARGRRRELAGHVRRLAAGVAVRIAHAGEVDHHVEGGLLNALERRMAGEILEELGAVDRIVADGERIFGPLANRFPGLEAVNDGESVHVAVAAASVVAKDVRDELFARLAAAWGEGEEALAGGGYVNAKTAALLRRWFRRTGSLPPETRRSWDWRVLRDLRRPRLFDSRSPLCRSRGVADGVGEGAEVAFGGGTEGGVVEERRRGVEDEEPASGVVRQTEGTSDLGAEGPPRPGRVQATERGGPEHEDRFGR